MSNIAYIFPGQGAQYVGMCKDLYDYSPIVKSLFERADKVLGFPLSKLMFLGPLDELTKTANCQPAILLASIAALEVFKNSYNYKSQIDNSIAFVAGLSLGEYTALVAAESLGLEDALGLVRIRGELMEKAAKGNPGGMASVTGLSVEKLKIAAKEVNVEIANLNCPGQIVISGAVKNLEVFKNRAQEFGAKRVIPLEVSGAFHSSLMRGACEEFKDFLSKTEIKDANIPVVSNVDAKPHKNSTEIRDNLIKQLYSSVLWEDSVRFMISQGVKSFIEIGPGKVLRGLINRIDPSMAVRNIAGRGDIDNA